MDQKICGYGLPDATLCRKIRDGRWCPEHGKTQYRLCVGGAHEEPTAAQRICPQPGCGQPLCPTCVHTFEGDHAPAPEQPFASPEPPRDVPPELDGMHAEILAVTSRSLVEAAQSGLLRFTGEGTADAVAAKILRDQGMHSHMKILSALALRGVT